MIILDIECYSNYWLASFLHRPTGRVIHVDRLGNEALDGNRISHIMRNNTTVSFNGNGYDLWMIAAALAGFDNAALKKLSDAIITTKAPAWSVARDYDLFVPRDWDHIDLIEVAPGQASLKIYGGRLHAPRLQDLPISPDQIITPDQRDLLRS